MSAEAPESPPVAVEDEDPAVIIAWLRTDEGDEWLRNRAQCAFYTGQDLDSDLDADLVQAPGDMGEDPCGRPPGVGVENAATREAG